MTKEEIAARLQMLLEERCSGCRYQFEKEECKEKCEFKESVDIATNSINEHGVNCVNCYYFKKDIKERTMTREEAKVWVNRLFYIEKEALWNKGFYDDAKEVDQAQNMAIEALSEPSGDLISRIGVFCAIDDVIDVNSKIWAKLRTKINTLLSVSTEPKRGEWVLECDGEGECDNLYRCPYCGNKIGCEEYDKPNFCPNCGADMRGDKHDRE